MREKVKFLVVFAIAWIALVVGIVNSLVLTGISTPTVIRQEYPVVVEVTPDATPSAKVVEIKTSVSSSSGSR